MPVRAHCRALMRQQRHQHLLQINMLPHRGAEFCLQIVFPELDGKVKGGPPRRIIQIAYLDDRIRWGKP